MSIESTEKAVLDEVAALKTKFENIKKETEEFIVSAKHLSNTGAKEAKELIDSAKKTWQSISTSFGGSKIAGLFSKAKKSKKKVVSQAKKAVKKTKKTVKKRK